MFYCFLCVSVYTISGLLGVFTYRVISGDKFKYFKIIREKLNVQIYEKSVFDKNVLIFFSHKVIGNFKLLLEKVDKIYIIPIK